MPWMTSWQSLFSPWEYKVGCFFWFLRVSRVRFVEQPSREQTGQLWVNHCGLFLPFEKIIFGKVIVYPINRAKTEEKKVTIIDAEKSIWPNHTSYFWLLNRKKSSLQARDTRTFSSPARGGVQRPGWASGHDEGIYGRDMVA